MMFKLTQTVALYALLMTLIGTNFVTHGVETDPITYGDGCGDISCPD